MLFILEKDWVDAQRADTMFDGHGTPRTAVELSAGGIVAGFSFLAVDWITSFLCLLIGQISKYG